LVENHEGALVRPRGEGDSRFAVFEMAPNSVAAAVDIQRAFAAESWVTDEPLRIRMGLHTGNADLREGDYYGSAVNRCARVRSLGHGGQVLLSLATEQLAADYLPDGVELLDLGMHPLKGLKRPEQVFQLVIPDVPSEFPPLQIQIGPRHNLPEQLTPFVGREDEVSAVRKLLSENNARLVTLKGPGGIGKTRLAIEVVRQEAGAYGDGARFVPLAPLDSADQIVQAFLESLDLRPASQQDPRNFLLQHLRRANLLMIVDNFEHVLDGAPLMAEILEGSPEVRLLATSRERLGLRGESLYDVGGLEFSDWPSVEQAMLSSCAQLFVQGARQIQPQFDLTEPDVPHLARICSLVDGTPLALLLSAGWMDMLSLEEIADEVARSLDFLETELRDAPARQRSVRAVFETSWQRLDAPERELFMRLSVFRGGFALEAAKQVAQADLRTLSRLLDKSFIRRELESGRYAIHELLRQYGERRLETADGASLEARREHAQYFAGLLAAKEETLKSGIEAEPLDEIEADIDNIRRAWRHLADAGDAEALQKSLFSLWFFHEVRGWLHAGRGLLTKTQRSLSDSSTELESAVVANQMQAASAFFALILGIPEESTETARRTLDWLIEHGKRESSMYSLLTLGVAGNFLGNPNEAIDYGDQLSALGKATGQRWWETRGKTIAAGGTFLKGDIEQSERYLEEYDQLISDSAGPWNSFWGKNAYARLAEARRDYAAAKEFNQSIIDSLQSVSFLRGMQYAYTNLGRIGLILNELESAEHNYAKSLRISQETGQMRDVLGNLIGLAKVWQSQGRVSESVEAVAAVLHHAQVDQAHLLSPISIREEADALRDELGSELDPDEFRAAWDKGSGEGVDEIADRIVSGLKSIA
jgi:predicted ATPase